MDSVATAASINPLLATLTAPLSGGLNPADSVGEQTTVRRGAVTVAGSGGDLTVHDAVVICGGVDASNAIVYLIDTVLSPPAE